MAGYQTRLSGEAATTARRKNDWQNMMNMFAMADRAAPSTMVGFAIGKLAREIFDNYNERGQAKKDAAAMNRLNGGNAYPASSNATNEAITSAMLASANPYAARDYSVSPQAAYANNIYQNALGTITNNELATGLKNAGQSSNHSNMDISNAGGAGTAYTKSALDKAMEQLSNNGTPEGTISQTTYSYTAPTKQDYKANALANLFGLNSNGNYF